MKKYFVTLLLALSSPLFALADDAVARPDVEELLTVMRIEKLLQGTMEQMKKTMPQMTANMLGKMPDLSADAAEKAKASQERIFSLVQEEMSWQKVKGDFVQIYAEALTPEEVKGITAFYKSPAGQAFLDKQPVIMQKTMLRQQKMMMGIMPKIQELLKEEIKSSTKGADKTQPAK